MHDIINRLRTKKDDEGFTLIELLVVVVIIGVLVAIAVPVYLNYRKGAADKSAQSDVRGAVSTVEQFYTDNANAYPAGGATCQAQPAAFMLTTNATTACTTTIPSGITGAPPGWVVVSDKTQLSYVPIGTSPYTSYLICATNSGGSGKFYLYDSSKGGSVSSAAITHLATCT